MDPGRRSASFCWTSGTTVHRMEQGRSQIKGPQIGALLRGLAIDDPKLEARLVRPRRAQPKRRTALRRNTGRASATRPCNSSATKRWPPRSATCRSSSSPACCNPTITRAKSSDPYRASRATSKDFCRREGTDSRKSIFRETPPSLSFMIDEAVLYRPFGSAAIMARTAAEAAGARGTPRHLDQRRAAGARVPARPCAGRSPFWSSTDYPDVLFIEGPRGDSTSTRKRRPAPAVRTWTAIETQLAPNQSQSITTYEGRLTNYRRATPYSTRTRSLSGFALARTTGGHFATSYTRWPRYPSPSVVGMSGSRFRAHGSRL